MGNIHSYSLSCLIRMGLDTVRPRHQAWGEKNIEKVERKEYQKRDEKKSKDKL